ncbi:hypothetical protein E3N88_08267 [Mikania micrantha]|uniref:DUF7722 domain-containing protein n=1 Tax=Mikania micrantha TaxID=192012 RepID=A0A5N6PGC0_9ASTR|nr:hypothetical protein E3N88_08267 [Mikania micrantha]
MGKIVCSIYTSGLTVHGHHDHHEMVKKEYEKMNTCSSFQMPLHYPRYKKEDYEKMPEWKLDCLLKEYGLPIDVECPHRRSFFSDNIIGDKQKPIMASFKVSSGLLSAFALVFAITLPTAVHGQPFAPTPAPANDGRFFTSSFVFSFSDLFTQREIS